MNTLWKILLPTVGGIAILSLLYVLVTPPKIPVVPVEQVEVRHDTNPAPTTPVPPVAVQKPRETRGETGMGNLFGPPPAPTSPPPVTPHENPPPPRQETPPAPEDPLQNYTYSGYSRIGERSFALLENNQSHEGTWLGEGDTFQGFTLEQITRDSLRLRQGKTHRDIALSNRYNVVPLTKEAPKTPLPDPGNLAAFRGKDYQSFYFQVTGRMNGSVWGTGTYTDDSALGAAAVHAGLLRDGETGIVHVTILPGYDHYDGSTNNGVTSGSYAVWQGSYRIDR